MDIQIVKEYPRLDYAKDWRLFLPVELCNLLNVLNTDYGLLHGPVMFCAVTHDCQYVFKLFYQSQYRDSHQMIGGGLGDYAIVSGCGKEFDCVISVIQELHQIQVAI